MRPTVADFGTVAAELGLHLRGDELLEYMDVAMILTAGLEDLLTLQPPRAVAVHAERDPGGPASRDEDPFNALVRRCRVSAQTDGLLSGVRVAVKDAIAIAGVPLTAGSDIFTLVPSSDSTVCKRLLETGAEIVGVTNMDSFGCSGGGDSSAYGPILNPYDTSRLAGGSSGGSAAALYCQGVTATVGCDQAGSLRVPAAWCGVLGLKPTFGLVPYTRIIGLDATLDHVGPMARTVEELARVLAAIAGPDGCDPRGDGAAATADFTAAVDAAPDDLSATTIGVLSEAVSLVELDVAAAFGEVVEAFRRLGASLVEISVPEHYWGGAIAAGMYAEATLRLFTASGAACVPPWPELASALASGLKHAGRHLSAPIVMSMLMGRYLQRQYRGAFYDRAAALRPLLRLAYDRALSSVDALLLPTAPSLPHKLSSQLTPRQRIRRGWSVFVNTSQFNMTGHPALTVPAAAVRWLPVGAMLVGRRSDDALLLAIARVYERELGWRPRFDST